MMRFIHLIRGIPLAILLVVAMTSVGSAAVLVDFDFSTLTVSGDPAVSDNEFGPLDATNSIDAEVTLVNGVESTGGHGIGGGGNYAGTFNWSGWVNSGTSRDYLKVVLEPTTSGSPVTITSMDLEAARNGAGAPTEWYVWIVDGNFTDQTDLDIADAIAKVDITDALGPTVPDDKVPPYPSRVFDLSASIEHTGTFSIVMGAEVGTGGGGGNLRMSDLVINGVMAASPAPRLVVDRGTGAVTLKNPANGSALPLLGYSITSEFGGLDSNAWTPISGRLDAPSNGGDGSVDSDNAWTILTAPGSTGDLSEMELEGGDGGAIANGTQLDFGPVWIPTPTEDLQIEYVLPTGERIKLPLQYVGDPIVRGDLNADGVIGVADWEAFLTGLNDDLSGLSPAQAYRLGDLVGNDLAVGHADFLEFKQIYDDANGAGSFATMVASVPEPGAFVLLVVAIGLLAGRRTRFQWV